MDLRAMAARRRNRIRACPECDLVVEVPALRRGETARCPRCAHRLQYRQSAPLQSAAASCTGALILLLAALPFPFVSFKLQGVSQEITLLDTASQLMSVDYPLLGLIVGAVILVLPATYLLVTGYLHLGLLATRSIPAGRRMARLLIWIEPWMMADVFLVAALVSLIKMSGDADIAFGPSFWAFVGFVILLIKTAADINFDALWLKLEGEPQAPFGAVTGTSAASQALLPCHCCGQLLYEPGLAGFGRCPRCKAALPAHQRYHLQTTWALLATAVILYIPANAYPIMTATAYGETEASTIMGGVLILWDHGSWPIALVILVASIVIPVVKILMLAWLCLIAGAPSVASRQWQHRLYRVTEFVGRWSMVDVFVVAILVALVQQGPLMAVWPGPAAVAFCGVVVLTMLAARAFDPRLIWNPAAQEPVGHTGAS